MAIVQAGARAITMIPDYVSFDLLAYGTVGLATSTQFRLVFDLEQGGTATWDFFGSDLTYDPPAAVGGAAPDLTGGTLSRMVQAENGTPIIDFSGMAFPAATFWSEAKANDTLAILSGILAGDDTLYGSDESQNQGFETGDDLIGFEGNDIIVAGAGFDLLDGGGGSDFLDGGADIDLALYGSALADYLVLAHAGTTGVIALGAGMDGVDKLVNVELLGFTDQLIDTPAENFRPLEYIASHADLGSAFGADAAAGFDHYLYAGVREGRAVTFNSLEYVASYGDLITAFGANADAGASHYITAGRVEGRTTSFDGLEYVASYGDLVAALGANDRAGANHFIEAGRFEGRGIGFDGLEYLASYGDLIDAFHVQVASTANPDIGSLHYLSTGYAEGRTVGFDPAQYLANYADLQAAFGSDTEAATIHYIVQGYFEGRTDHHV